MVIYTVEQLSKMENLELIELVAKYHYDKILRNNIVEAFRLKQNEICRNAEHNGRYFSTEQDFEEQ